MRAAAGLNPDDPLGCECTRAHEKLRVPFGVDIICDRGDLVALAHLLAQSVHQRGLARADWAANTDTERAVRVFHRQLLNRRVYCVSCLALARSARNAALPISLSSAASARSAVAAATGSSAAKTRWPSVCPSGIRRTPADTQFASTACR